MNKQIQKLFISVLSLIFALTLFGTATYAWFSISTVNILHNISLEMSSDKKFQISLDGINYYDEISSKSLINVIGRDVELTDVTSHDGLYFLKGGPDKFVPAIKNVDYVSFTLYFRFAALATTSPTAVERNIYLVDDVSTDIYLNNNVDGTYVVSKGINWKADSTFINGKDEINDIVYAGDREIVHAAEAVRIGFVEKIINKEKREEELINKIFDLSRYPERGYGTSYGSLDYYNVKHNSNFTPPETIQDVVTELSTFDEYDPRFPLNENSLVSKMIKTNKQAPADNIYYEGKVEVNIWLEGWDADCFDAIYRDKITIKLKFKTARDLQTKKYI